MQTSRLQVPRPAREPAPDDRAWFLKDSRWEDPVTWNVALTILQQEVEHEEDLQSLKEDLDLMVSRGSR